MATRVSRDRALALAVVLAAGLAPVRAAVIAERRVDLTILADGFERRELLVVELVEEGDRRAWGGYSFTLDEEDQEIIREGPAELDEGTGVSAEGDDGQRRRRRRGGRGRGRGRGRAEGTTELAAPRRAAASSRPIVSDDEEDEDIPAPRPRSATPFGSVWDSQLGTSTPAPGNLSPLADEEFDDEPEIPEYLIAERNRGRGGRGRGGARGGRAAYQSAIARERYGRGGSGGINRYPDVSERT